MEPINKPAAAPVTAINAQFIKNAEGLCLQEYFCSAGKRTIGYGHACGLHEHYPNGITRIEADRLFEADVKGCIVAIRRWIKVPLNKNQLTALVSLVFNCGEAPIRQTLGKLLNAGQYDQAADVFLWWNKITDPKPPHKLIPCNGLSLRRAKERELFLAD